MPFPKHVSEKTQFKPGQSGNPAGRPKGARNRSTIARRWLEVIEKHVNPISGEKEELTQEDIITLAQINKARKGDSSSYRNLLDSAYGSPDQNINATNNTKLDLSSVPVEELEKLNALFESIANRESDGL